MTKLNVYNKKLIRSQKQSHRSRPAKIAKRRFISGDNIIVISGAHKGKITKVLKQIGNHCFLEETKVTKHSVDKALKRNKISNIHIKIHESNLMHYDEVAQKASKVSYRYDIVTNPTTNKENKIRVRIYKASGREEIIKFVKKSDLQNQNPEASTPESETTQSENNSSSSNNESENNQDITSSEENTSDHQDINSSETTEISEETSTEQAEPKEEGEEKPN